MERLVQKEIDEELVMLALIEGQSQDKDVADATLKAKLIENGMDKQRAGLYMLGQAALQGEEGDILRFAQNALLGERIAALQIGQNVILQEQIAA